MQGRTLSKISDFSIAEQKFLYEKAKLLKQTFKSNENYGTEPQLPTSSVEETKEQLRMKKRQKLSRDDRKCAYLIFMENSTRTKESFRNAAGFHENLKINDFDCSTSSFAKGETITDCMKMLVGYSEGQTLFVIRSKLEGVCKWLEYEIGERFCTLHDIPRASFINAGDGKHEHPTQELLDEFTFLERADWNTESIHVALIGDLYHGRTAHSKADGLRVFTNVTVDLIAPPELAMPEQYEKKMKENGFSVNKFQSLDEYLTSPKMVAKIWYFTRLQLERMSQQVQEKSKELRKAVTFNPDHHLKFDCFKQLFEKNEMKFFHPLPRDSRHPVIPFSIDNTSLNGWDAQSRNGYFVRTILLGLLGGWFDQEEGLRKVLKTGFDGEKLQVCGPPAASSTSSSKITATTATTPEDSEKGAASNFVEILSCKNTNCISYPENGQREVLPWIVDGICQYCDHVAVGSEEMKFVSRAQ
ncbi:unnamed protein product [Amoebophrya sp. A120]|nr:unnamed protein product [Amoebophrya sp. A120]|eukprot:GSA120T00020367001.1